MTTWDDIRFWHQVIEDGRRTVFCSPELESRVKMHLAALGLSGAVDVQVSPFVPDDQLYVADLNGIAASTNQAALRSVREWRFRW